MGRFISVRPSSLGWIMEGDAFANRPIFRSGAEAERCARRLAQRYASIGETAEVRIYLRDGSLAGCYSFVACDLALAS